MNATYIIQQHTDYQWEPIREGDFETLEEATAAMESLETDLGWRDLRIVKDHEVILVGTESDE